MSKLKMRQTPDTKQNLTDYARESSGTSDPGRTSHITKHDDQIKQINLSVSHSSSSKCESETETIKAQTR